MPFTFNQALSYGSVQITYHKPEELPDYALTRGTELYRDLLEKLRTLEKYRIVFLKYEKLSSTLPYAALFPSREDAIAFDSQLEHDSIPDLFAHAVITEPGWVTCIACKRESTLARFATDANPSIPKDALITRCPKCGDSRSVAYLEEIEE